MANSTPKRTRPLSPNIQIYRPQLTSVLSIANRITGVVLSMYAVALVVWLVAAPPDRMPTRRYMSSSDRGSAKSCYSACLFLFLHLCGGIRHLVWDAGYGFRSSRDIRIGMDGGGGEHGADCGHLDCQHSLGRIEPMNREPMRSPLGHALGLGSAKNGVEHWWLQRVTAIALVPLTVWFAASIVVHTGNDYATLIAWLKTPIATILMALLLIASLLSHGARPPSRDRGLRPLRNENSSAARNALWLLCAGRRGHLGDPADRFCKLRAARRSRARKACIRGGSA